MFSIRNVLLNYHTTSIIKLSSIINGKTLSTVPSYARVVICGAGVVGNSVAYHLMENGWKDIVILDQDRVGSGTSFHGSGLVGQFRSPAERRLVSYAAKLYSKLQDEGQNTGWKQCGSLNVAQTTDRWISIKRYFASCRADGLECELLSAEEIKKLHPYVHTSDLHGGVWFPSDGTVNSLDVCLTFANCIKEKGVQYIESCKLEKILTTRGKVTSVVTNLGIIECDYFVNCAGLWARDLSDKSDIKVRIPVHAAQLLYITTKPLNEQLTSSFPSVRDFDESIYCREFNGGFLVGGFESYAKPVFYEGTPVRLHHANDMPDIGENYRKFKILLDSAKKRIPILEDAEPEHFFNGPENFSADGHWIIGETPEVDNYYVAVGMNGNSVQAAPGIGKAVADWIVQGQPTADLLPFDIRRFRDLHNTKKFLRERVTEIAASHYKLDFPMHSEFTSARKMRCSPLYTEQEAVGAVFGEVMGFERPLYYDISDRNMNKPAKITEPTFGKPGWFPFVREEYLACRKGVGLIDLSSLSKFEIKSAWEEVVDFLQLMCSNDIGVYPGSVVQSGMQNESGGFENDCVLLRRAENLFLMICPAVQHTRMTEWMNRYLPTDGSVVIDDVSSMYTVLSIVGPKSKELLNELTNVEINIAPYTCRDVSMGYASGITTVGFTQVGEPGFLLFIPSEYALHIYEKLMNEYGIRNVGHFAQRMLRIEKFIPFWGEELDSNTTPYEVGLGHRVKLEKEYFLGKSALLKQYQNGVTRRLVYFTLENHDKNTDLWPWGQEPILRNGVYVGNTTSSGFGFTVGKIVCMGFVKNADLSTGEESIVTNRFIQNDEAKFEIDIAGTLYPLEASLTPPKIPIITFNGMNTQYTPTAKTLSLTPKKFM